MAISLQININIIRIADVDTGSAVCVGNNFFYDWQTYSKTNNGFGRLSGDRNSMMEAVYQVDDCDFLDMFNDGEACGKEENTTLEQLGGNV